MSHTENFPRKAFETACHAMGVLEQNREYLQFHLKNADEKTQQALADMQRGAARLERAMSEIEDLLALHDPPPARRWMDLRDVLAQADAMGPEIARYKDELTPAIILIPGKDGSLGIGMANVKSAVERAVGADIL